VGSILKKLHEQTAKTEALATAMYGTLQAAEEDRRSSIVKVQV